MRSSPSPHASPLWLIPIGTFAFLFGLMKIADPDVWWHLATGRWILSHHAVPTEDVFSFPTLGQPWQPNAWLSDVFYYLLHQAGGEALLSIAAAGVVAAALSAGAWIALRAGSSPWLVALLVLAAVPMVRFRVMPRPHVFELLFAIAAFGLLEGWHRRGFRSWLWMAPLMLVWANAHASFLLGFVIIGAFLVEAMLATKWPAIGPRMAVASGWKPAWWAVGLTLAASFCTPFGTKLWSWVLRDFFSKSVIHSFEIEENARLAWGSHPIFWGWMGAGLLLLALAGRRNRPSHIILFALSCLLAFSGVRFIAVAVILQFPILARALQALAESRGLHLPDRWMIKATGAALLVAAAAGAFVFTYSPRRAYQWGIGGRSGVLPDGGIRYLDRFPDLTKVYTSWDAGGYYSWAREGRLNYIDGRCADAQMALYDRMQASSPGALADLFDEQGVQAALVTARDFLGKAAFATDAGFRFAYFDDQCLVFLRQDLRPESGFACLRPEFADPSYLGAYAKTAQAPSVLAELERALRDGGEGVRVRYLLGYFSEINGRAIEAMEHYRRGFEANPRLALRHYPVVRRAATLGIQSKQWVYTESLLKKALGMEANNEFLFLLGTCYYQSGRLEEAEAIYRSILRKAPKQTATLSNLGYLYFDQKKYDLAFHYFLQVQQMNPRHPDALYGAALTLTQMNRTEEAKVAWETFLRECPSHPLVSRAQAILRRLQAGQAPALP